MRCARRSAAVAAISLPLFFAAAAAQEPIFITPPVTMFQQGGLLGVELERRGSTVAVSSDAAFGITPSWTLALHAVGIDASGSSPELARVQLGTRLRLVKVDRPREWLLLSVYGAGSLPLGGDADRVAETNGVPREVVGVSAARMARSGDVFADVSLARTPAPAGSRTSGAAGVAVGWRPSPADYGTPELQLFGEIRGRYAEGGAAELGLAPGVVLHTRNALLKLGVLFPTWTRQSGKAPAIRIGAKLLL
ncbi:MAG: hypothetical protein HY560_00105 [Gemmatimonadetes bacterium]|nr:hypothetical protein [Gemmatimonadota bacterium]